MYYYVTNPLYCNRPDGNDDRKRSEETSKIFSLESAILIDKFKGEMSRAVNLLGLKCWSPTRA